MSDRDEFDSRGSSAGRASSNAGGGATERRSGDEMAFERLPPDEAFGLLAHETRLRALEVLNDADGPLAFGELRERVDVDDPGRFNYHLGKLVGRFVRKVADADGGRVGPRLGSDAGDRETGYELAVAGRRVVGAVLSGGYTRALDADPVDVDADCENCGAPMRAAFHEDGVRVGCEECPFDFTQPEIPAGALDGRRREEVPAVVDRWLKRTRAAADYGFCLNCDGRFESTLHLPGDPDAPAWLTGEDVDGVVRCACERCGHGWYSSIPATVLTHPAVAGFHYEHGVDLRETLEWDLDWWEIGLATVTDDDPVRIEVPITLDDETLVLTLDGGLDVVEATREG